MHEMIWIVTKEAIAQYTQAVGNAQPLCFSDESAEVEGFSNILAPSGFLGQYQILQDPMKKVPKGGVHIRQKMKWHSAVQAKDRLRICVETIEARDHKNRPLLTYRCTAYDQEGGIVCESETINLLPAEVQGK